MLLPRTNIQKQLSKVRDKAFDADSWRAQVQQVLLEDAQHEERILENLDADVPEIQNDFDLQFDASKYIHICWLPFSRFLNFFQEQLLL